VTEPGTRGRRAYARALGLLVAGGVALIVAFGRTWSTTTVSGAGLPTLTVTLSGTDLTPAGVAVGVLALAGVAGLAATRRAGRVLIGVLLVLAGLVVSYVAWDFSTLWSTSFGLGDTIRNLVAEKVGGDVADPATTITGWWILGLLAGLVVAAGGLLAVVTSGSWPEMGRRYERGDAVTAPGTAPRARSAWDQLDEGIDPTADPPGDAAHDTSTDPTLGAAGDA
jgi:uncharacterized membrane protein (TIGR02234 family)